MKRNNVILKVLTIILLGSSLCMSNLGGCALLPAEDAGRVVPTVVAREAVDYNMVVVTRTDIVVSKNISCTYSEKGGIDLAFETGGKDFKNLFVKKGSTVKAGEVIGTVSAPADTMGREYNEGAHLHFEMLENDKNINPTVYLDIEEK